MEVTARFDCIDAHGNHYVIEEWQTYVTIRQLSGQTQKKPGSRSYQTRDGSPANYIDEDTFEVLDMRSSAPNIVVKRIK